MPQTEDVRIDRLGPAALRDHSVTAIEEAIATTLSKLAERNLSVNITLLDFGPGVMSNAKVQLEIYEVPRPIKTAEDLIKDLGIHDDE